MLISKSAPVSPSRRSGFEDAVSNEQPSRILDLELELGELTRKLQFMVCKAEMNEVRVQALERQVIEAQERAQVQLYTLLRAFLSSFVNTCFLILFPTPCSLRKCA